jgi:BCD family chlorophyll transporter-like MFS transporter
MRWTTIARLGLVNVAVALTFVPIDSTLNRVMISDLQIPATLVALLITLPYLFSPIQIWIGNYSDQHPLFGYRRTPYILLGLLLCTAGAALTPSAAMLIASDFWPGMGLGLLAFGAWGMGFNFSTVSYLSLTTDLSSAEQRPKVIGTMWFMLIVSVIIAGISISRALRPYSEAMLFQVFYVICGLALVLGVLALLGLEPRYQATTTSSQPRSFRTSWQIVTGSPQARLFFGYLILLLIAILGQDVLLEPYAADVFGVPIDETSRYVSIWGIALLAALLLASPLTRRVGKLRATAIGGSIALIGLLLIALSGLLQLQALLIPALVVFGFGSGLSTATNLALMLDMTVPGQVGAFIGAWGMADAFARLLGTLLSGVVRDGMTALTNSLPLGYILVFMMQALALGVSLVLLPRINVARFRTSDTPSATELSSMLGEARN